MGIALPGQALIIRMPSPAAGITLVIAGRLGGRITLFARAAVMAPAILSGGG